MNWAVEKLVSGCALFLVCLPMLISWSCTPGQRQALRTALDITQTLCIVANAQSDDVTVAQVCGITEALLPEMRRLASAQRTAAAQHARNVGACK